MAETIRHKILDNLYEELSNIKTANGYANDIVEVRKGFFDQSAITNFPTACVYFGSDVLVEKIEGQDNGENSLDIVVLTYINSPAISQADNAESLIEDLYKFFNRDSSINKLYYSHLLDIECVQAYDVVEVNPYLAGKNNISAIGILIKVDYMNFIDSTPQPVPDTPTLLSPANGATDGDVQQAFNWSDESDAQGYRFQITDDNFTSVLIDQTYLVNSSYTIPDDAPLSDGTTYQWRVRALGADEDSAWTNPWSFTVNDNSLVPLNPSEVGNCILWLRSDTGITLSGSKVTTWNDQSASSFHLANSTDANRPTLLSNAFGSHSAVNFDGTAGTNIRCLGKADTTGLYKVESSQTKSLMITMMGQSVGSLSNALLGRGNTNNGIQYKFHKQSESQIGYPVNYYTFPKGSVTIEELILPFNTGELRQAIITINGTTGRLYVDGVCVNTATISGNGSIPDNSGTFYSLGSAYFNNTAQGVGRMYCFEHAWWNKVLTDAEIDALYLYHKNFYGV